jgi:hypothetical protein
VADTDETEVDVTDDVDQFAEAIAAFRDRVPVTDDEWAKLQEAERKVAFKIANVTAANVIQQVFDSLESALRQGQPFQEWSAGVGDMLQQSWGGEQPGLLETVFRNATMSSYNAGRFEIHTAPAVKKERPYWRFSRIGDGRVSDICRPCEGVIVDQDDGWWDRHYPQLHHGCRHRVDALTEAEAERQGITRRPPSVDPQPGFGHRPPRRGSDWTPDMTGFEPGLRKELDSRI